jgi:hypothetical protein
MIGQFTTNQNGLVIFSLPDFNLQGQISWLFHVYYQSKTSETYEKIIGQYFTGESGSILNFNDKTNT